MLGDEMLDDALNEQLAGDESVAEPVKIFVFFFFKKNCFSYFFLNKK